MKKKKEFGNCCVCGKKLTEYHLSSGTIKVCSFECQDKFVAGKKKDKSKEEGKQNG